MADYRVYVGNRSYDIRIEKDLLLVNGDQYNFDLESINGNGLHILRETAPMTFKSMESIFPQRSFWVFTTQPKLLAKIKSW
jgi:hypothetical protein